MSLLSAGLCHALQGQGLRLFPSTSITVNFAYRGPVYVGANSSLIRCKIDAFSYLNTGCLCATSSIGRFCSIAENVRIGLGQHDVTELSTSTAFCDSPIFDFAGFHSNRLPAWRQQRHSEETSNVTIGHDVWIGANLTAPLPEGRGFLLPTLLSSLHRLL